MRIALAQTNPVAGDLERNADELVRAIRQARERGCALVVTPETAITVPTTADPVQADARARANVALLTERVAPEAKGVVAVVGFVDCQEDAHGTVTKRSNAAALIEDGRITAVAREQRPCSWRRHDESRSLVPARETTVVGVDLAGRCIQLGILVGGDLWGDTGPTSPCADAAAAGAALVAAPTAVPFGNAEHGRCLQAIRAARVALPLPLIFVNPVGIAQSPKDVIVFDGRSAAFDSRGRMAACARPFAEELAVVEFDQEFCAPEVSAPPWDEEEELFAALVFALRQYCHANAFRQVVLGVSGGVDSSLCAVLAAEALGPENVLAVSLPTRHNAPEGQADAAAVCANLGVEHALVPIEKLYGQTLDTFGQWRTPQRGVTRENFQARLRAVLLMGMSNDTGRLLLAAGNKTELGQGYCTLYGDTAGGLAPIGDLNKMQVYRLSECANRRAGAEVIPRSVLRRVPSAELSEGQRDPFDYPVVAPLVDEVMAGRTAERLRERFRGRELGPCYPDDVYERYDEEAFAALLDETFRRYHASAFKRSVASPVILVSPPLQG